MTTDTATIRAQMDALQGFTPGPWEACNNPGDWGLGGAWSIVPPDANPYEWDQCISHVEYQTPYCLGEKQSVIDAANLAGANARLIAAAPDMHATILGLCDALDAIAGMETQTANATVRRMASTARAALAQKDNKTITKKE